MAGHTRQKETGVWEARWTDGRLPNGRPKYRGKTFRTKREAQRFLDNLSVAKDQGTYIDPARSRTLFSEVAEDWLSTKARSLKPKTLENYSGSLRRHVLPYFGSAPVGSIDFDSINRWITTLINEGRSPSVIRVAYKVLRLVLGHAVRSRKIAHNPANKEVDLPNEPTSSMLFLTATEVERLALAFPRPEQTLLVRFAAWTGLRAGEIGALKVRHLNLSNPPYSISVEESVSEVNGQLHTGTPKTKASRRSVLLPSFLAEQLKAHLATIDPNAYVFTAERGGPMRHSNFRSRFWHKAVIAADLSPALRFHDLRHTAVALSIEQGAHPKAIAERMGHASVMMTLDRYGHLFPRLHEVLAERLDAAYRLAVDTPEAEPAADVVPLR
jgi:integrase